MNAKYNASGMIIAIIGGGTLLVPDDMANRHRQMIAEWEAEGNTIAPYVAPAPQPPHSITPLQARDGLRAWGISRAQIDAYFANIADETEREAAQDAWEYATQIDRADPLVAACADFLGKTDAEIDQFFIDAAS